MFRVQDDVPLSPLLDPLEGLSRLSCGKLGIVGRSQLPALKRGKGRARNPGIRLGRGTIILLHDLASKTNHKLVRTHSTPFWVLGQIMGTWTHLTHQGPDSGEATTFPLIVFSAAPCGGYIRMAFFPKTPKVESQKCPGLDSRDFGRS